MNQNYEKYINEIFNTYNAYRLENRNKNLDRNTHKREFSYLIELLRDNSKAIRRLLWIKKNYDYHHQNEYGSKYIENLMNYLKEHAEKQILVRKGSEIKC